MIQEDNMCTKTWFICFIWFFSAAAYAQFNAPESVVFDSVDNRYFVSNNGNGTISQIAEDGNVTTRATGLTSPCGLTILGDVLYSSSTNMVRGYYLADGSLADAFNIMGASFLNDVTNDGTYLYVTDSGNGRVYRIDVSSGQYITLATPISGSRGSNGIYYDAIGNRLIVGTNRSNSSIFEISLPGGDVSTILETPYSVLDGITADGDGNIYMSSIYVSGWNAGSNTIYRWPPDFSYGPDTVSTSHHSPADIYYNVRDNILAVPNLYGNTVEFVDMSSSVSPGMVHVAPELFVVESPYPNPFNPTTTIPLTLRRRVKLTVDVYNVLGTKIATLASGIFEPGNHHLVFHAKDLTSGVYFIRVQTDSDYWTKKIVLMK